MQEYFLYTYIHNIIYIIDTECKYNTYYHLLTFQDIIVISLHFAPSPVVKEAGIRLQGFGGFWQIKVVSGYKLQNIHKSKQDFLNTYNN